MNIKELSKKIKEVEKIDNPYSLSEKTISYSQFSMYSRCPKSWELSYIQKKSTYEPSIHMVFGTAFHETLQNYLKICFEETIKKANSIDINQYLRDRMVEIYSKEVEKRNGEHFSTSKQLLEFWEDGCEILKWLKNRRGSYFSSKQYELLGIETPLIHQASEINDNVNVISYLDLVFWDKIFKRIRIIDIKTSTRGWNKYDKSDSVKKSQVIIYKHYFSKMFSIPIEDVEVEFFIVKRKLLEECDFVQKRVQSFIPSQGRVTINRVLRDIDDFISNSFNEDGSYNLKNEYYAIEGENKENCKYCEFKDKQELCPANKRIKTKPD